MEGMLAAAPARACAPRVSKHRVVATASLPSAPPAKAGRGLAFLGWKARTRWLPVQLASVRQRPASAPGVVRVVATALSEGAVVPPDELVLIRAYVRWEEAGKPADLSEEQRSQQYVLAKEDLQRELEEGVTINQIRERYGLPPLPEADLPPPPPPPPPAEAPVEAPEEEEAPPPAPVAAAEEEEEAPAPAAAEEEEEEAPAPAAAEEEEEEEQGDAEPAPDPEEEEAGAPAGPPPPEEKEDRSSFTAGGVDTKQRDIREVYHATAMEEHEGGQGGSELERWLPRWANNTMKGSWSSVTQRICQLGEHEMLVELRTYKQRDPEAQSGPREVVTQREVVVTAHTPAHWDPLVLHWGVARDEPGQWILPRSDLLPEGTEAVNHQAVETVFEAVEGCIKAAEGADEALDEECVLMQMVKLRMPGEGSGELLGLQFVVRSEDGSEWFKDPDNGWGNFQLMFGDRGSEAQKDPLVDTIVRAETTGSWWTLMHRYNLCSGLIDQVLRSRPSQRAPDMAKLFVWLRLSAIRQLTWQRNYNVKPRELAHAQKQLTDKLATVFRDYPSLRELAVRTLATLGRGGDGGDGQKIRDEILNIMHRNHIKEVKGQFLEEWHQKLHNNTTPDDVIICEAYLAFMRGGGDMGAYWAVLEEGGIDRARLESYERPIVTEPQHYPGKTQSLIREFVSYGKILRAVHSGADFDCCVDAVQGLASGELRELLAFVAARRGDGNITALIEAAVEARHLARGAGLVPPHPDPARVKELMYLDVALEQVVRLAVERHDPAQDGSLPSLMHLISLVGENLALSSYASSEELVYCLAQWRRLMADGQGGAADPLHCKSVLDRMAHWLASTADRYNEQMQGVAEQLGTAARCEEWTIKLFTEEVVRSGPGFSLSLLLQKMDPLLRQAAHLSPWQVISPVRAAGWVEVVDSLADVQNDVYARPTVVLARHVSGGEEIPLGATAVLSGSSVDVLSHSAVRARNSQVLFATCFDPDLLRELEGLAGGAAELAVDGDTVTWQRLESLDEASGSAADATLASKKVAKRAVKVPPPCKEWALGMAAFSSAVVGAKSKNTLALREQLGGGALPDWVNLPRSLAVPFGAMERALQDPINEDVARDLAEAVSYIDETSTETLRETLDSCRSAVAQLRPPEGILEAVGSQMEEAGLEPPSEAWGAAWKALVGVWASKWTERAYISVRNVGIDHADLRMSVLVQQIIPADYAFVIHTVHPSTGDENQVYAEVVRGLGEVLVGNYPGRALAFTADKDALDEPRVVGYPSKSVYQHIDDCFIFRSDSNGEDLEGYAGAGLYDSIPMYEARESFVDYSLEPLLWDAEFQREMLSKVAQIGAAVEAALGAPQDIEGVVKDGQFYVVQTRPQV